MVMANLGRMVRAGPAPESAGAIPYGVAIAIGTIVTLAGRYG